MSIKVTVVLSGTITETVVVYSPARARDAYVEDGMFRVDTIRPSTGQKESCLYPLGIIARVEILEVDDA